MIHTITLIHEVILFDSQASNLFELQPALTYGAIDRTGYIDHIFSFERIDFCMFIDNRNSVMYRVSQKSLCKGSGLLLGL